MGGGGQEKPAEALRLTVMHVLKKTGENNKKNWESIPTLTTDSTSKWGGNRKIAEREQQKAWGARSSRRKTSWGTREEE